MADPFTVIGGIASIAQILGCIIQTAEAIKGFCDDVQDAPAELQRIKNKLIILKGTLAHFQQYLDVFDDDIVVPPEVRETLILATLEVQRNVEALQEACKHPDTPGTISVRRKLKWAFIDRHVVDKLLLRLQSSENTLNCVGQLLHM
jgi:hypothetical protein